MRTLGEFAKMGRKLPAGTLPLLVLAILMCLAVFSPRARADDTSPKSSPTLRQNTRYHLFFGGGNLFSVPAKILPMFCLCR